MRKTEYVRQIEFGLLRIVATLVKTCDIGFVIKLRYYARPKFHTSFKKDLTSVLKRLIKFAYSQYELRINQWPHRL